VTRQAEDQLNLLPFLDLDDATKRVRRYYTETKFTGRQFEWFAGGGDRPETRDCFTSDDIVAISLLSVYIPGEASLAILQEQWAKLNALLADIPNDVDLRNAPEELIVDGGKADQLWQMLENISGVGWVTAGKLCARKRPRLIPVYDRIVKAALSPGRKSFWTDLRNTLRAQPDVVQRLDDIRSRTEINPDTSLLRVLDVAVWMMSQG
jgi:hypothetical protein